MVAIGVFGADDPNQVPAFRDPVILREQVLLQLRKIIDPDLYQDIVTLGFIKKLEIEYEPGRVSFTLELTTPACPVKDQFVEQATTLLKELGWVSDVNITLSSRKSEGPHRDSTAHLMGVNSIICVASCKGGVGKSSVAVNLAFMLKRLGASVGLVDADVYGPSLPQMVPVESATVYFRSTEEETKKSNQLVYEGTTPITKATDNDGGEAPPHDETQTPVDKKKRLLASGKGGLVPVEHGGVKMMSAGYLKSSAEYAAVRGPLASGLAYQMVAQTFWGALDYLIIDMPPGTGDVHLTIAQSVRITAAVMVTTPQQLSLTDVEKGIHMFNKLDIPTIAIVENMTYFACPNCGIRSEIFNTGEATECHTPNTLTENGHPELKTSSNPMADSTAYRNIDRLIQQFGVQYHIKLPLHPDMARLRFRIPDDPTKFEYPFTLAFNDKHFVWNEFKRLGELLAREVSALKFAGDRAPDLRVIGDGTLQVIMRSKKTSHTSGPTGVVEKIMHIPVRLIRLSCRCAECVDEYTGTIKLQARKVPIDVHPKRMNQSGTYAVSIEWSDKHNSLISFTLLEELCKQYESGQKSAATDQSRGVGCGVDEGLAW